MADALTTPLPLHRRHPRDERVVFSSDVHLHGDAPEEIDRFAAHLRRFVEEGARAIYLHGDLFDFYVGPRQGALPVWEPLFGTIRELTGRGIHIAVQKGNRDFLIGKRFRAAGAEVLPDTVELEVGGRRVRLSHGDEYCIHDHSYQFWARRVLRSWPARTMVQAMPLAVGFWVARRYRGVSKAKARRWRGTPERLPTILDGVAQVFATSSAEIVICGHIHHLAETAVGSEERPVRLLTTGSWQEVPNWIVAGSEGFELVRGEELPHVGEAPWSAQLAT